MDLYEKIKELAAGRKISIRQLEEKLGIANGTIRRWSSSNPSTGAVEKVADYFHVSIDFLIGRTDPDGNHTPEYSALQRRAKKLSQADQRRLLQIMDLTFTDIDKGELDEDDSEDF